MRPIDGLSDPAQGGFSVTPADSDFSNERQARALYIGGAGDVSVVTVRGDTLTFASVPAGTFLPVSVRQVRATGTNASNIVALY